MKILEVVPQLNSGGAERFVVDLCNELCERNDVYLVVLHSLGEHGFYKNEVLTRVHMISLNKKKGFDLNTVFHLFRIIKNVRPDVVHTHLAGIEYAFLSSIVTRRIHFFHTVHNDAIKESTGGIRRIIRIIAFKMGLFVPVTISQHSNDSFKSLYGMGATLIVNGRNVPTSIKISDGVQKEFCEYRKNGRVLVQLARFEPQKRHVIMARVVNQLALKGYHFSVLMIGNQSDKKIVQEVINIGSPYIYLLGQKHNPLEYLKMADAFCLCSSVEGMPISLIEALAVGAVPVCTPVGGINDAVRDGENGLLSDDLSEESYLRALERFLTLSDESLLDLKTRAKRSFAIYNMANCANSYLTLFQQNCS